MIENINENKNKKKALGRGLGSLLGSAEGSIKNNPEPQDALVTDVGQRDRFEIMESQAPSADSKVWMLSIEKIHSGKFQPRKHFDKASLEELAQSIKQNGILQPIIVRRAENNTFEIVAGERRWRAAQLASMHEVPVIIRSFDNKKTLQLALIENIQREDLNPIEEAEAYARLVREFNLTQADVAEKVGKDRSTVTNLMRLLGLPSEIKELIKNNQMSLGHAKVLLSAEQGSPESLNRIAKKIITENMSVRKLEKEIARLRLEGEQNDKGTVISARYIVAEQLIKSLEEDLQKNLGTKVQIEYNLGKGKVSMSFYSDEELNGLIEKLKDGCSKNKK